MIGRIEREGVQAPLLTDLKNRLVTLGLPAARQIARLERYATRLEWSHNEFFKPFAAVMMWSTHVAVAIEAWRRQSGPGIPVWIDATGEFEALSALACYRYEHPSDIFPELDCSRVVFDVEQIGHPLLPEQQCVRNDIAFGSTLPLVIISGSNMSGKSTMLRTVGLSTVLAWAGAPVRARKMVLSPVQVAASIRVQDSLQDGRSRFYAEITRLRQIVDLTSGQLPVLFLLDELLSGTNSHDREIGAAAIVGSLIERGAVGFLTTHDLALAHIATSVQPAGVNVHFVDTIEEGKLHFDYQLHPGVVERSNALELMRSVGLEV
jgi:DNA mismatch repair ATPase MutS